MKTDKQQLMEVIEAMPDGVSAETIITELQFRVTMLRRGEEAARGVNTVSHEDARKRLGRWLNSTGT